MGLSVWAVHSHVQSPQLNGATHLLPTEPIRSLNPLFCTTNHLLRDTISYAVGIYLCLRLAISRFVFLGRVVASRRKIFQFLVRDGCTVIDLCVSVIDVGKMFGSGWIWWRVTRQNKPKSLENADEAEFPKYRKCRMTLSKRIVFRRLLHLSHPPAPCFCLCGKTLSADWDRVASVELRV
ncbi:CCR4-NOT transcription complex subunit 1 [Striga asiatica]|uniref:CCR4-NOT transcription complex subunit 1 n=1 Tax=Striga asiatica TaxID=4170 RepID=A0A5A7PR49_STRAF|nr:CCR4-NOT transcription complex subunit 1 [Striga asiatica]